MVKAFVLVVKGRSRFGDPFRDPLAEVTRDSPARFRDAFAEVSRDPSLRLTRLWALVKATGRKGALRGHDSLGEVALNSSSRRGREVTRDNRSLGSKVILFVVVRFCQIEVKIVVS